ncbi:MAG: hypothetical protein IK123_02615 [Lachnospiraceae bacterium]|nr:hypothetical protein [Lachnospiraceae bacterium]
MSTYNPGAQGVDLKRICRQFIKKIWVVIAAIAVGAIIGILTYVIYSNVKSGNTVYRISNDYYITLNYEEYPNGVDYYNAYTWDGILRDDPVVNYALTLLPGVTKQQILDSVTGEILGDYRLLTVNVTGTDKDLVQKISDAYKEALPHFATEIDMISGIEVWTDADMVVYDAYTRDLNAALLGAIIGLVLSVFGLLLYYIVDDGFYSERDWVSRYPDIPYLGISDTKEAEVNISHILGSTEGYKMLQISDLDFNVDTFDAMRASKGVILDVREGRDKGEMTDKVIYTLKKQDISVKGAIFRR